MTNDEAPKFAHAIWAFQCARTEFEDALDEAGFVLGQQYQDTGWDEYDNSIEFYRVSNDVRLTDEQQRIIYEAGFGYIYVNHNDAWVTHYYWDLSDIEAMKVSGKFIPKKGWRRRWVPNPNVNTTRNVGEKANAENAGYYEVSEWPSSWDKCKDWLKTGFIRVVG